MLNNLPSELIEIIIGNLRHNDVGDMLMVNKYFNSLKYSQSLKYIQPVRYEEIKYLRYSDNFINLKYVSEDGNIPNRKGDNKKIRIGHLTLGDSFNDTNTIPESVTHLTFGVSFNKNITGIFPIWGSITHLTFGYDFNKDIHEVVPNSVTHLTFGYSFNKNIHNSIPPI